MLPRHSSVRWARRAAIVTTAILAATLLLVCGENARLPAKAGIGAAPAVLPPAGRVIPTIAAAPARGWAANAAPTAAPGLQVTAFARGLDHPRWRHVMPFASVSTSPALVSTDLMAPPA